MKALSIRQPWAWAILHAGKDVENRDWHTYGRNYSDAQKLIESGEPILLHTGVAFPTKEEANEFVETIVDALGTMQATDLMARYGLPGDAKQPFRTLPYGGIVGQCRFTGITKHSASAWFFGPLGLLPSDIEPTRFVPCKGALGFFDVPDTIVRQVLAP